MLDGDWVHVSIVVESLVDSAHIHSAEYRLAARRRGGGSCGSARSRNAGWRRGARLRIEGHRGGAPFRGVGKRLGARLHPGG